MMPRLTLTLVRVEDSEFGAFGLLYWQDETVPQCWIAEPPWRDNAVGESCIPCGEYLVELDESPRYGRVYHVRDVSGRSNILLHAGNYAGDETRGLRTDTNGCLLPGARLGELSDQRVVLSSRVAMSGLHDRLQEAPFRLVIREVFER